MHYLNFLLILLLQAPAPAPVQRVVVGLTDGQKLVVENAQFSGFIQSRGGGAVLRYRQPKFHGEMPTASIARIDFGRYEKGQPFTLNVTLKNGQQLSVVSEHRDFMTVTGSTDVGTVFIKQPDPVSAVVRVGKSKPNRKNDLTIQYLEFPSSTE